MPPKTTERTAYVVEHSMVGPHFRGEIITFSDDDIAKGVDIQRLLSLGAIRPALPGEGPPVPYGQGTQQTPFPAVPFEATPPPEEPAPA